MRKWTFAICSLAAFLLLAACSSQPYSQPQQQQTASTPSSNNANTNNTNNYDYNSDYSSDGNSSSNQASASAGVQVLENDKVGKYLADSNGMTLYYFKKDQPGVSNCKDDCLLTWPPFTAEKLSIPNGLNSQDFGAIKRDDTRQKQVTYKGFPLYYFSKDKTKGDTNGQGVKNVWFVINNNSY
ncbi:hypothetical protein MK805_03665 [Shimazuella sp. AN120528]|uniref:COG4315 family predicted lipoprotein n=1 Tax=Shimazuella soli TaxID=1892854 RepID=UPI001F10B50F|nr:hypothetical protein [Shimazuella soli]MCH5584062.1 hypothetical protein [Shimazuella soli]